MLTIARVPIGPRSKVDLIPIPYSGYYGKNVIMSVWRIDHVIMYRELLPTGATITAEVYCAQLENLKLALSVERLQHNKEYYLDGSFRPHLHKSNRKKL